MAANTEASSPEISLAILSPIAAIDEFKGAWRAICRIAPERLSALRRVATIERTGSSTRSEGAASSDGEVERLLAEPGLDGDWWTPHLTPRDVYDGFGVSESAGSGKSRAVRKALDVGPFDPKWTLPSRIAENAMVWMVMVDGFVVDIRDMPREMQEAAYEQGVIPYMPDQGGRGED